MINETIEIDDLYGDTVSAALSEFFGMGRVLSYSIREALSINKELMFTICCSKLSATFDAFVPYPQKPDKYLLTINVNEFELTGQNKKIKAENLPLEL